MALYVYNKADGKLVSWCPSDSDPVAEEAHLAAGGLAVVTGLPALDATHDWSAATMTVIEVEPPDSPALIATAAWIMRFTAPEFAGIQQSSDPAVQQFFYAVNHTTILDLADPTVVTAAAYLTKNPESLPLLAPSRLPAIMAPAA